MEKFYFFLKGHIFYFKKGFFFALKGHSLSILQGGDASSP